MTHVNNSLLHGVRYDRHQIVTIKGSQQNTSYQLQALLTSAVLGIGHRIQTPEKNSSHTVNGH